MSCTTTITPIRLAPAPLLRTLGLACGSAAFALSLWALLSAIVLIG